MPLSRASTRGRYSRTVGVTQAAYMKKSLTYAGQIVEQGTVTRPLTERVRTRTGQHQ